MRRVHACKASADDLEDLFQLVSERGAQAGCRNSAQLTRCRQSPGLAVTFLADEPNAGEVNEIVQRIEDGENGPVARLLRERRNQCSVG